MYKLNSVWFQPARPSLFYFNPFWSFMCTFLKKFFKQMCFYYSVLFFLFWFDVLVSVMCFFFFLFSHQLYFPFSTWKSDVWSAIGLTHSWLSVWSVSHTPQQVSHCHIRLYSLCSWNMQNNMQCFQYRNCSAVQIQNSCLRCAPIWNKKIGWD